MGFRRLVINDEWFDNYEDSYRDAIAREFVLQLHMAKAFEGYSSLVEFITECFARSEYNDS